MTTLIAYYTSDGCEGRCDAKCYDAHEPECDCICGGRNHGAGKEQALDNIRELAGRWLDQARTVLAVIAQHDPPFTLPKVS